MASFLGRRLSIRRDVGPAGRCYDRRMSVRKAAGRGWARFSRACRSSRRSRSRSRSRRWAPLRRRASSCRCPDDRPATSDFFVRALEQANARAGVGRGASRSTRREASTRRCADMVQAILASNVPVVTYVSPSGPGPPARGTFLLYASHVAAMAPATNLGAATPVADRAAGRTLPEPGAADPSKTGDAGSAMERKSMNDAIAYIRGLAELRGRNVAWARPRGARGRASRRDRWHCRRRRRRRACADLPEPGSRRSTAAPSSSSRPRRRCGPPAFVCATCGRLADRVPLADHEPERRLPADAHRHLRAAPRGLQPGHRCCPAWSARSAWPARAVRLPVLSVNYARLAAHRPRRAADRPPETFVHRPSGPSGSAASSLSCSGVDHAARRRRARLRSRLAG